jgi:hypothetical protein
MEQEVIAWDAPEYHYIEKSSDWFWMLGIISISIAVLCILFGNTLFGIFISVGAISAGLYAAREPALAHYELQPKGILSGTVFYPYSTLDSFWIDEHHPLPRIILKSKKMLMPHIIVPFNHIHPDDIKDYLLDHLKEEEHKTSLAHRWLEHIGL